MDFSEKQPTLSNRKQGEKAKTEEKYRKAVELYSTTQLACPEICRICGVTVPGLRSYILRHHRDLLLARYGISCNREQAQHIKLNQLRGQLPTTRAKYQDAINACKNIEYIELNLSQIARQYRVNPNGLCRQLRTHYPEILEWRENERKRFAKGDNLVRGMRSFCQKQYAKALELLRDNSYITVQEVADSCGVSYTGLEQHLIFYHKDLVKRRIKIREKAIKQQRKGEITGRGTIHAPLPATVEKYVEAVELFRTTLMSVNQIAKKIQVSKSGLNDYLQRWHKDLICQRKNIQYTEGDSIDWSKIRKYNPATKAKYAQAICKLKKSRLPTSKIAAEFGLHPECFRAYLKEHEPDLYARQGMTRTSKGDTVLGRSMEKYSEAMHLYATTTESLKSLARKYGVNDCALRQFIQKHFPELIEQRKQLHSELPLS